jgi:hypothetical protein
LSFDGCAEATFADYCASVQLLAARRVMLIQTLEQTERSHAPMTAPLRCFRGLDTLTEGVITIAVARGHSISVSSDGTGERAASRKRPAFAHIATQLKCRGRVVPTTTRLQVTVRLPCIPAAACPGTVHK